MPFSREYSFRYPDNLTAAGLETSGRRSSVAQTMWSQHLQYECKAMTYHRALGIRETVKTVSQLLTPLHTRLKPGANETTRFVMVRPRSVRRARGLQLPAEAGC